MALQEINGHMQFEWLPDGRRARLTRKYSVIVHGHRIDIPEGFVTDFASIPRIFWRVLPPWDKHVTASVIHDWLYKSGRVSRALADQIFLWAMEDIGVAKWKRTVIYWGVRVGGWVPYNNYRKAEALAQE